MLKLLELSLRTKLPELLPYSVNHVQSHLDAVLGVVHARVWKTGHAVVAVAQDLDAQAVVVLKHGGQFYRTDPFDEHFKPLGDLTLTKKPRSSLRCHNGSSGCQRTCVRS